MTFTDAVRTCLSKYITFTGRAARSEYWFFVLFIFLAVVGASILDGILSLIFFMPVMDGSTLTTIALLGLFLPHIAVGVRRLHDTIARAGGI